MKAILFPILLFVLPLQALSQESLILSHEPMSYFFPDGSTAESAFVLAGQSGGYTIDDPGREEKSFDLLIVDDSIDLSFLMFGYKTDLLTSLSSVGGGLDYCSLSVMNEVSGNYSSSGSSNWDLNECANAGSPGLISEFSFDYTIGDRKGVARVKLETRTTPKLLHIFLFEFN